MSRGRCPGCGAENASCKVIRSHMMTCEDVQELYRTDPARVVDPEVEYRRYAEWKKSPEGQAAKAERNASRAENFRSTAEAILERQRQRWGGSEKSSDPLANVEGSSGNVVGLTDDERGSLTPQEAEGSSGGGDEA